MDHVKEDRAGEDLLFEVLLRLGVDPTARIDVRNAANQAFFVVPDGPVIACLAEDYDNADVAKVAAALTSIAKEISPQADVTVVLRDSAFVNDVAKTNLLAALEQSAISNVKTI
jgi:adenine-specific DNA-methyltransferase